MSLLHFTEEGFNKAISGDLPVLVDFWATWCGPCRMIAPSIEQIAAEYEGKAIVGKVDVDAEGMLAMKYNITSIPTVMVFKNGEIAGMKIGAMPKEEFSAMLDKVL